MKPTPKPNYEAALIATLAVAADNAAALEAACLVLRSIRWSSCRALAKAVHDACEEIGASVEAREYLAEELDVRLSEESIAELRANGGKFLVSDEQLPNLGAIR